APSTRQARTMTGLQRATWFWLDRVAPPRALPPPPGKIDPGLTRLPGASRVSVIITYEDTVTVPRFPALGLGLRADSTRLDSVASLIAKIDTLRSARYSADTTTLATTYGATHIETFWLIQAVVCNMAANRAIALAALPEVVYVRRNVGPEAP